MPVISRIVSIIPRIGEIAFAAVVAGIIGSHLDKSSSVANWPHARIIYAEIIAGISILLGLIWLIPFKGGFFHWPIDIILSLAWFAAFGLLVNFIKGTCHTNAFDWTGITHGGVCGRWRAAEAFSFLSAVFWLASALLGLWFLNRERRRGDVALAPPGEATTVKRPWYRRSHE